MADTIYDLQMQKINEVLSNPPTGEDDQYVLDIAKNQLCPKVLDCMHFKGFIFRENGETTLLCKW